MTNCTCGKPIAEHSEGSRCLDVFIYGMEEPSFHPNKSILHWIKVGNSIGTVGIKGDSRKTVYMEDVPHYSTDMNHAIELLKGKSYILQPTTDGHMCKILTCEDNYNHIKASAKTLALAICIAGLLTLEKLEGKE